MRSLRKLHVLKYYGTVIQTSLDQSVLFCFLFFLGVQSVGIQTGLPQLHPYF